MASKRTPNAPESRAETGEGANPPSRLRLKLNTIDDVRRELARLYREGKAGTRDVTDVSKLANVLQILGRLIEGADLERRIEELEQRNGANGAGGNAARPH